MNRNTEHNVCMNIMQQKKQTKNRTPIDQTESTYMYLQQRQITA